MKAKDLQVGKIVGMGSGDHGRYFRLEGKIDLLGKVVGNFVSLDGARQVQMELVGEIAFGEYYADIGELWWPEGIGRDGQPLVPQRHEVK